MERFCRPLLPLLFVAFFIPTGSRAQSRIDDLFRGGDTTRIMDSLMKDFGRYLDSLSRPKSFFAVQLTAGTGVFSFENKNSVFLQTAKKPLLSPQVSYYHRSGFGLSAMAFALLNDKKVQFYQYAVTPSYDYIKRSFSAGIAYTKYFTRDSLDFYTTPVQNELFGYFTYKDWPVRPAIGVSFGWGSNVDYEKRRLKRQSLQLQRRRRNYYVLIRNEESVRDLSINLSVRKDFNFESVLWTGDNVTVTPAFLVNSGTQNFGFNTSYTYQLPYNIRVNSLPQGNNISGTNSFALQSLSTVLRTTYMFDKLTLQPQVLFDYYIPESDEKFTTIFSVTAGWNFD
jgi:hypothetical protein